MTAKAREPWRSPEATTEVAALLARLKLATKIERDARTEVDRLMAALWVRNVTDHSIATAMGVSLDVPRMRRRRRKVRPGTDRTRGVTSPKTVPARTP